METASEGSTTLTVAASRSARTLAGALHQRGRLTEARARLDEARRYASEAGNSQAEAFALDAIARLLVNQGDLRGALDLTRLVISEINRTRSAASRSPAIAGLTTRAVALHQLGDLTPAARALDEADSVAQGLWLRSGPGRRTESHARGDSARCRSSRGCCGTVTPLRGSVSGQKHPCLTGEVARYARAGAPGRGPACRSAFSADTRIVAADRARRSTSGLSLTLTDARLQLARGAAVDPNTVRKSLDDARREAERLGFDLLAMELEMGQARAEIASGLKEAGRRRLQSLERRAASLGAGLLVRRIRHLANQL